jgi:hypothetical protein
MAELSVARKLPVESVVAYRNLLTRVIHKVSFYLTVNTLRLDYKDQAVNAA